MSESLYKPEYDQLYIDMASKGKLDTEFAANVGISVKTMYNWAERHSSFKQARELGKLKCEEWYAEYLRNKGTGDKHQKGDFQAIKWLMMNKFGWTDKQVNHLTADDASIKIEIVRPEKDTK